MIDRIIARNIENILEFVEGKQWNKPVRQECCL